MSFSEKKGRFGLIGTITWDTVELASGKKWQGPGGILYQAATLCALGFEVSLICQVGEEIWPKIRTIIKSWPGLITEGIKVVPGLGNQVYLYYPKKGERKEKLKWAVPPLRFHQIFPVLKSLDFLLVVFNSGFDLDFYTWRQIIKAACCPIWLDIHSLVLSSNFGDRKYESLETWPAWVDGVNYLQANEREAACLLGRPNKQLSSKELDLLAQKSLALGLEALFVTLGKKGVFVATADRGKNLELSEKRQVVDTTGCGDCLAAATAAKLYQGESPLEAGRFGLFLASQAARVKGVASTYRLIDRLIDNLKKK
ncbi:MAG: carbohydrate kinase family protein [Candidatus Aminicenantes bacterium]|nr:carbohydrate kinase family protein [Candidatus Aminicenantes bacterium]